jgi:hypothetical protein
MEQEPPFQVLAALDQVLVLIVEGGMREACQRRMDPIATL